MTLWQRDRPIVATRMVNQHLLSNRTTRPGADVVGWARMGLGGTRLASGVHRWHAAAEARRAVRSLPDPEARPPAVVAPSEDALTPSHVRGVRQGPRKRCSRRSAACGVRRRSSPFAAVPSALLYRLLYCCPASARVGQVQSSPAMRRDSTGRIRFRMAATLGRGPLVASGEKTIDVIPPTEIQTLQLGRVRSGSSSARRVPPVVLQWISWGQVRRRGV